jgi:hypothetical protein
MEYNIKIGSQDITLVHDDLDGTINVDELTKIDTSNIFGDAVTISAAVNRIGLIKAEVAALMAEARLEYKFYEGTYKNKLRKQAVANSGFYTMRIDNDDVKIKLSETSLATSFETDPEWMRLKRVFIEAEKNFNSLDSLYWSCQDKSRKLNSLVGGTTPREFLAEMVEGKINGFLLKK